MKLKNNFRCFYLNIVCIVLAVVSETAFIVLPGKNTINFYISTGTNPIKVITDQRKVNFPIQGTTVFGLVSFIFLCLRVKLFSSKSSVGPIIKPTHGWMLPPCSIHTKAFP